MKISFIHIGLAKTASTYMQNAWLRDGQFTLAFRGVLPVVDYVRKSTSDGTFSLRKKMDIKFDEQPSKKENLIVSNEGFTSAYLTETHDYKVSDYIDNMSQLLGTMSGLTSNVLVVVRSPISWLRSIHSQFINEGGFGNFSEFYSRKREFLEDSMDLQFIKKCYSRYFDNIVFLPMEYLKESPEKFWGVVSSRFGTPMPELNMGKLNESVPDDRLYLMSEMNRLSVSLRQGILNQQSPEYGDNHAVVNNSKLNDRWLHRRFCQQASDTDFCAVSEMLGIDKTPSEFRKIMVEGVFAEKIKENFISVIEREIDDPELVAFYDSQVQDLFSEF